ncbi:hypothetical protein AB0L00_09850 [Actinoallomurus sp. NPDC052308]|uniref:hypothetical protein n=1 Tax=Actinoallomurus sp. NPDC052308 TaxID=3155530 RepID=UPI0034151CDF
MTERIFLRSGPAFGPQDDGRSGGWAEQVGEQGSAVGGGSDLQVRHGAVQVEAEVEERAAPLFFGGERGQFARVLGGRREPYALVDGFPPGTGQEPLPVPGAFGHVPAGERTGHRCGAPPFAVALRAWGRLGRRRGEEAALGIAPAGPVGQGVQASQRPVQRGGEGGQLRRTVFGLRQAGGHPGP